MLGIALLLSIPSVADAQTAPKVPYPEGPQGALLLMRMGEALERGRRDAFSMVEVSAMMYYTPAFVRRVKHPEHHVKRVIRGANGIFANSEVPLRIVVFGIEEINLGESPDGIRRLDEFLFARSNFAQERAKSLTPMRMTNFIILTSASKGDIHFIP